MKEPHEDDRPTEVLIPRLVNVDRDEWKEFQELCGPRGVSQRIRELVREDIRRG